MRANTDLGAAASLLEGMVFMTLHEFDRGRRHIHELVGRLAPAVSVVVLARPFGHFDVEMIGARGSYSIPLAEAELARLADPTGPERAAMKSRIYAGLRQIGEVHPTTHRRGRALAALLTIEHVRDPAVHHSIGHAQECDGCLEAIVASQSTVEVDLTDGTAAHFHPGCFRAWQAAFGFYGDERPQEGADARSASEGRPDLAPVPAGHRPKRVLVVEDDGGVADLLTEILYIRGYEVHQAHDGAQALRLIEQHPYDAVITAVRLPTLDGIGLYRELQTRYPELGARVAFTTGRPEAIDRVRATGAPILPKPFTIAEVDRVVSQLTRSREDAGPGRC